MAVDRQFCAGQTPLCLGTHWPETEIRPQHELGRLMLSSVHDKVKTSQLPAAQSVSARVPSSPPTSDRQTTLNMAQTTSTAFSLSLFELKCLARNESE